MLGLQAKCSMRSKTRGALIRAMGTLHPAATKEGIGANISRRIRGIRVRYFNTRMDMNKLRVKNAAKSIEQSQIMMKTDQKTLGKSMVTHSVGMPKKFAYHTWWV